jgi:Ca2+/H+ antiporter
VMTGTVAAVVGVAAAATSTTASWMGTLTLEAVLGSFLALVLIHIPSLEMAGLWQIPRSSCGETDINNVSVDLVVTVQVIELPVRQRLFPLAVAVNYFSCCSVTLSSKKPSNSLCVCLNKDSPRI